MPGKVLLATAAVLLAGAGFPTSDMYLGRVAGTADAVDTCLTLQSDQPTVSVRVSNTTGRPGRVVGWLGDKSATAVAPDHSAIVTLTWDSPAPASTGVMRLELYPEDQTAPKDVEEHPFEVGSGGYHHQPPSGSPKPSHSGRPKPSHSNSPKPSASTSEAPGPSKSVPETPSKSSREVLPETGSGTSFVAVLGGGSVLFGLFVLGVAWVLRRRHQRDQLI